MDRERRRPGVEGRDGTYIQAIDGPQLESVRSKATRAIINKWHVFVQQNLANSYGLAKTGVAALATASSFVIPEAASSLVKKLPTAINAALDLGLGIGKASVLDKQIGTIDAAKDLRREALARQLARQPGIDAIIAKLKA